MGEFTSCRLPHAMTELPGDQDLRGYSVLLAKDEELLSVCNWFTMFYLSFLFITVTHKL